MAAHRKGILVPVQPKSYTILTACKVLSLTPKVMHGQVPDNISSLIGVAINLQSSSNDDFQLLPRTFKTKKTTSRGRAYSLGKTSIEYNFCSRDFSPF